MKTKEKRAFTLTELLVVVIVIGVLSAVVLPKFSKVVETRKTTEAEELMSAVRTEQEKRCALDKNYLANLSEVTNIIPSQNTKNFTYSLTSTGMEAASKGKYGYKLRMPSYKDGRICCENGAECAKLNKDYPLCDDLVARLDYQSGAECAACTGEASRPCGCKNGGRQTRTCDASTGTWSGWSACSIPDACSCEGESTQSCGCQGKGTRSRTCNTSNGTWSEWGSCSVSDACECVGTKPEESQSCNECGTRTRSVTCNASTGQWSAGAWSACDKTPAQCVTCKEDEVHTGKTNEYGCECKLGNPVNLTSFQKNSYACCAPDGSTIPSNGGCCGEIYVSCMDASGRTESYLAGHSSYIDMNDDFQNWCAGGETFAGLSCGYSGQPPSNCTVKQSGQAQVETSSNTVDYQAGALFRYIENHYASGAFQCYSNLSEGQEVTEGENINCANGCGQFGEEGRCLQSCSATCSPTGENTSGGQINFFSCSYRRVFLNCVKECD